MHTFSESTNSLPMEAEQTRVPSRKLYGPRLLWQARTTLFRAALAGLLAAAAVAFMLPVRYQSTAQLMPPDTTSASGMAMLSALGARATPDLMAAVPEELLGFKSSGALLIGVLRSRTVEDRIVDRFSLRSRYRCKLQADARQQLAEYSSIYEDRKSGIITIEVTDRSREQAAAIAQAYVDELNRLVAGLSTSAAHRERLFLEQRLSEVKQNVEHAAQQFSEFATRHAAVEIQEQGRAMIETTAALKGQLVAAESELSGLEQIYKPRNVRVRSVEARVDALRQKIAELRGASSSSEGARDAYPSLRNLPALGVTYSALYRETKTQEAVFDTLTMDYELAKVQEAKETPSVKTLDDAEVPERRSYPPRLQIMFAGMLAGFGLSSGWVLGKAKWEQIDNQGKALATEIFSGLNSHMPWSSPNGSRLQAISHRLWVRWLPTTSAQPPR